MNRTHRLPARRLARWALSLLAAGTAAALWSPSPVAAETTLASSTPAADATVDTLSTTIELVFSAPIGPSPVVTMACGSPGVIQALGDPVLKADQVSVSVALLVPAPKGPCVVGWKVTDTNLQPAGSGSFGFVVSNETVVTTTAPTTTVLVDPSATTTTVAAPPPTDGTDTEGGTSSGSSGPLGLFRLISNLGLAALFGGLVVIATVWPSGPEYQVTHNYIRVVWAVTAVGTYLYAASLAAEQSGSGLGSMLIPTSWVDLFDTTPGKAAVLRFLLVLGCLYVVASPFRAVEEGMQLPALGLPALAVATVAFSRAEFGFIEIIGGVAHSLAMSVWLGGLLLIGRVVLHGPGEEDLVQAVVGFRRISGLALWATVLSGGLLAFQLDRGSLGSSHGLVLLSKTLFVALMVAVSLATGQFVAQRMVRAAYLSDQMVVRLRRPLTIEAVLGVVALGLTSWMLSLNPPGLSASDGPDLSLEAPQQYVNNTLNANINLAFSQRTGANDVRIEMISPATGTTGLRVEFLPPLGSSAPGMVIDPIPLTGAGVAVLQADKGFTLGASGTWTVLVYLDGVLVDQHDVFVN
ncbi:MAG: copper resistance protein CopC [Acidobacteria bacterium]|nr:copper resistance protein CopC [Acidobacteriota bacterium]